MEVNDTCQPIPPKKIQQNPLYLLQLRLMKLYSQKDKQILRALELMVNATNNEEAINFLKLFSITQRILNPQAIAQLRLIDNIPSPQEYLMICLITRATFIVYCPAWFNLRSSNISHQYMIFGGNVTENIFLTISPHQNFNIARVPNNFFVYCQNQILILFVLLALILLMGIISKACFFPRFHLRIIEQDERSLIDISSEYIAAIKKKDYYLYCLTLNLFCDYNELQFASIFVCLFLQMTNPTMSPPTSIGVASYLLLYFYLVIYLGIIAMQLLKLLDLYLILRHFDLKFDDAKVEHEKIKQQLRVKILYFSFISHRALIKKSRISYPFSLFYSFFSLFRKFAYAMIISIGVSSPFAQLMVLDFLEFINIGLLVMTKPHQTLVNYIQIVASVVLATCISIKLEVQKLTDLLQDPKVDNQKITLYIQSGWVITWLYVTYCILLLIQCFLKIIKEIKRYIWQKRNKIGELSVRNQQLNRQLSRTSIRIKQKMERKEVEFEEYLKHIQTKNIDNTPHLPKENAPQKKKIQSQEVGSTHVQEVRNQNQLDNYLNPYEEYLHSYQIKNKPDQQETYAKSPNEKFELLKSLYPEGTVFYPEPIIEIQMMDGKTLENSQKELLNKSQI